MDFQTADIAVTDRLIVAVSGGPDSMALLRLMVDLGYKALIVAHVDHGLRSDSRRDVELVRATAGQVGVPFELLTVSVADKAKEMKMGIEEAGRVLRYEFFETLRRKHNARFVVTAHHADDQVETVLLNIVRGCGLKGLAGMDTVSGTLWRPILSVSKKELLKFCKDREIEFAVDQTNGDLEYKRNYLRKKVIPHLKKLNPGFLKTFQNSRALWKTASDYFERQAKFFLVDERLADDEVFHLKAFLSLSSPSQMEVLRQLYLQIHGNLQNLQLSHLEQVLKTLCGQASGKKKEFGPGKMMMKQRDTFEVVDE